MNGCFILDKSRMLVRLVTKESMFPSNSLSFHQEMILFIFTALPVSIGSASTYNYLSDSLPRYIETHTCEVSQVVQYKG